jgi:protein gp37
MAENSAIEWTHHTFNPWRGCTKVSEGCKHCYAETLSGRNPKSLGVWGPRGSRSIAAESYWKLPAKWNAAAKAAGERHRVFCASLADVFEGPDTMPEADWPLVQQARKRLFNEICLTPHLDWLLLTKRPENALQLMVEAGLYATTNADLPCPQPNLWIGTSVENQAAADLRIPQLMAVPAAVRFLSCEPLLGPVDLRGDGVSTVPALDTFMDGRTAIDWVIVGGESGPNARPMHPAWARSIRDQCERAGVPFLFKQWGEWAPAEVAGDYSDRVLTGHVGLNGQFGGAIWGTNPPPALMVRVGKKPAGRSLDGREWNGYPNAVALSQ